jgi:arginyl-tRNA synthetase
MEYTLDRLRNQIKDLIVATGMVAPEHIILSDPKPNIPADVAFPTFQAARGSTTPNPNEFAQKLVGVANRLLPADSLIGKIEATAAFVNFSVSPERFAKATIEEVLAMGDNYGSSDIGNGKKVVIDFSSPNIARKMHVGHLRTTIIGNAIRNILNLLGYQTIADNHLGDWGTQFGSLLAALEIWGTPPNLEEDPIEALVQIYAKFNTAAGEDPSLKDLARQWFAKLEKGDETARQKWKWMVDITMQEFDRTYQRLGISFDVYNGESYYEPMLDAVVNEALEKGVAKIEPDGAVSVDFGDKLPSYLIRKTDGATLYQTRDIATCIYRWNTYHPDRNIYVVGQEQKLHFQQVFETMRRMGYTEIAERSVHIANGPLTDAQGQRFSMRKGTAIFLEEVLDEALQRARTVIDEKMSEGKTDLTAAEKESVSQAVSIGAVIYNDLYQDPGRGIRFEWDKMLSFDGNSAPYIQYTHARCCSILRKANLANDKLPPADFAVLTGAEEQAVIKQLAKFSQAVRRAGDDFLPAIIAEWTYTLAREFARFYHEHPVLEAPSEKLRLARLSLTAAVAQGLRNGLALLGIKAPAKM